MRGTIGCALLLMMAGFPPLARAQPQRAAEALSFQQWEPGLEALQGEAVAGGKRIAITAARGSFRTHRVEVAIPEGQESGDTVATFQEHSQATAVLSGGFLKSFYPPIPLGLVKHSQKLVNRPASGDLLTGILVIRAGKPAIQAFRGAQDVAGWDEALQAGPLLVSGGHSALPSAAQTSTRSTRELIEKEHARAFVAILPNDQILLAATGAVTLPALVDLLTRPAARGGLECLDALNLSGAESSGVLVRAGGRQISAGNIQSYLANAIILAPLLSQDSRRTQQRAQPRREAPAPRRK